MNLLGIATIRRANCSQPLCLHQFFTAGKVMDLSKPGEEGMSLHSLRW